MRACSLLSFIANASYAKRASLLATNKAIKKATLKVAFHDIILEFLVVQCLRTPNNFQNLVGNGCLTCLVVGQC